MLHYVILLQATDADPDEHTITTVENPAAIVAAVEEPVPQPEKIVLPVRKHMHVCCKNEMHTILAL